MGINWHDEFHKAWDSGPFRRSGKEIALARFLDSVKTEEALQKFTAATAEYGEYCRNNRWYHPMLGSVWFGNRKGWRDWVPDQERPEAIADDPEIDAEMKRYKERYWARQTKA